MIPYARYDLKTVNYNQVNLNKTAVALGKFQGLHKGHMLLIDEILRLSEEENLTSVVFTIDVSSEKTINLPEERYDILEKSGVDYNVTCEFSKEFASLSPVDFVESILVNRLDAKYVVVGTDFRFGYKRLGNVDLLRQMGEKYGFKVIAIEKLSLDGTIISSTYIRELIVSGKIKDVLRYMGRSYSVTGTVKKGRQLGRTIGFPTANIIPDEKKILPPFGAYCTEVVIGGMIYKAITNVGDNPTIDENNCTTIETNIPGFSGDIYGKEITVYFKDFIRGEKKFTSIDELKEQLQNDIKFALHQ